MTNRPTPHRALACLPLILALCGCVETTQRYTLNPDGSGKVDYSVIFQPVSIGLDAQFPDPADEARDSVRAILENTAGVDVWRDVEHTRQPDGRIQFSGTAYYRDVNQLDLHKYGIETGFMKVSFTTNDHGSRTLRILNEVRADAAAPADRSPLSDAELEREVQARRAEFRKMGRVLPSLLATMKFDMSFVLPGRVAKATNMRRKKDTAHFELDGLKMLSALNKLSEDDQWWRQQIRTGYDLTKRGPDMADTRLNKLVYGSAGPVVAHCTGTLEPLFDYDAEVAAAREGWSELLHRLGAEASIAQPDPEGRRLADVGIVGLRHVGRNAAGRGVRPFGHGDGLTVALAGRLPLRVLTVTEGEARIARTVAGVDLLRPRLAGRRIHFPALAEDGRTVLFEVGLRPPESSVAGFAEIGGVLNYLVAEQSVEVDVGIKEFQTGAAGSKLDAAITTVGPNPWAEDEQTLTLELALEYRRIKGVAFFDEAGEALIVRQLSASSGDGITKFEFAIEGMYPPRGSVRVDAYTDLRKYELPFTIRQVDIFGAPIR